MESIERKLSKIHLGEEIIVGVAGIAGKITGTVKNICVHNTLYDYIEVLDGSLKRKIDVFDIWFLQNSKKG